MHIFGMTCFCYEQNKAKVDPCCEKSIFVGYDKQKPAYLIYFLEYKNGYKKSWVCKIHWFLW